MFDEILKQKKRLEESKEFEKFKKEHKDSFFISAFLTKDSWDLHFYCPHIKKAGCFSMGKTIQYFLSDMAVEGKLNELKLENVNYKLSEEDLKKLKEKYVDSGIMNQILSLQNYKSKIIWNITWLTSSLSFINLKINAFNGKIIEEKKENIMNLRN